ncbi:LamG domain-containing protein [bacterium]|nr:LamG domain-containing protein [bacterium]
MPDDLPVRKPSPARSRWDLPLALLLCGASAALAYAIGSRDKTEGPKKTLVESQAVPKPVAPLPPSAPLARVAEASAVRGARTVVVRFATPVDRPLAELTANYAIEPGVEVEAAALADDARTVTLTTSPMKHGTKYRLVVSNVAETFVTLKETRAAFRYEGTDRVTEGIVALYTFDEGEGDVIHEASPVGTPLDLRIVERGKSAWTSAALVCKDKRYIVSDGFADRIVDACRAAKAVSVELWIKPAKADQYGSPEIILLGWGKKERNFSLSQEGPGFIVRLRTTKSSDEGETFQARKVIGKDLLHVVFTRDVNGNAVLYVDGKSVAAKAIQGDFANWRRGYRLLLGPHDEYKKNWDGEMHLVAIYARALTEDEVKVNHAAGPTGRTPEPKETE